MDAQGYCTMLETTLLHLLDTYRVPCLTERVDLYPRSVRLYVRPSAGIKHGRILSLQTEICDALRSRATVVSGPSGLYVEAPLPADLCRTLAFSGMLRRAARQVQRWDGRKQDHVAALLGLGDDGHTLVLDLAAATTPHILLVGTTGCGKTNLLKTLLLSLARLQTPGYLQISAIDAKGFNLPPLSGLPHILGPVATSADTWPHAMGRFLVEMERRLALSSPVTRPRQLLVIDELADVLSGHRELEDALMRVVAKGREVGCHVIVTTQRPDAASVKTVITANLPLRIVGTCATVHDATLAAGRGGSLAHELPGQGTFVAVPQGGAMERFTAPLVTERDIHDTLAHYGCHDVVTSSTTQPQPDAQVIDFLARLRQRQAPIQPGRPPKPLPPQVIDDLVAHYSAEGAWPSRRAVGRLIGRIEGVQRVNDRRAQIALDTAQQRVASSCVIEGLPSSAIGGQRRPPRVVSCP